MNDAPKILRALAKELLVQSNRADHIRFPEVFQTLRHQAAACFDAAVKLEGSVSDEEATQR